MQRGFLCFVYYTAKRPTRAQYQNEACRVARRTQLASNNHIIIFTSALDAGAKNGEKSWTNQTKSGGTVRE